MATLPKKGLYISTKKVEGMRLLVEDVFGPEDGDIDEDGFYLVNVIDESSKDDYSAMGDEMDNTQWQELVDEYGLMHHES